MKSFKDVVLKKDIIEYLNGVNKKTLLIYSPTSAQKMNLLEKMNNKNLSLLNTHITDIDIDKINNYLKDDKEIELVIGFGGGTAIDIAKYIGSKMRIKIVAIPSMLSTNVYSTDKVLMSKDNIVSTLDSRLPDLIIYDENVLKLSLLENLYGFADVLTIYTASKDWYLSFKYGFDNLDEDLYKMDIELLDETKNYILSHTYEEIKYDLFEMFNFIGRVGLITNLYGSGRPVSGSEHIFAKALEQKILVPHGISVALGILIMSLFQNNFSNDIEKCFEKLKIFDFASKYKVTQKLIKENLYELTPRKGRYTIVNTFDKKDIEINNKIDQILDKFNIDKGD